MHKNAGNQLDSATLFNQQQASPCRQAGPGPLIIADGLRTPENIGGIIRLADAMGCPRIILVDDDKAAMPERKISRIARGTDKYLALDRYSKKELLGKAAELMPMIAVELTTRAENLLKAQLPRHCSLVIGSERHGISEEVLALCQRAVCIPMYGVNGSMNVSQALAMVLYEWRKQYPG